ncbi:MAG: hypothetical protein M9928_02085 [Anaerolineae bacterium]|nr:hypothetical protein [Anaerolineae bacterium]MCO5197582.1 hypothetical protein [Anaerolineae bacterium]MCO5203793.1 hypothetical protein [Anaerolineae bacterium]
MSAAQHPKPILYRSFVLHIWHEGNHKPDEDVVWRMSLEDPHSAERVGFKNANELISYLVRWMDNPSASRHENPKTIGD